MIVKVIAQIDKECQEKLICLNEGFVNTNNWEENGNKIIKEWRKLCKGVSSFSKMFDILDEILSEYDIEYYDYEDNVDEVIKAIA